MSIENFHDLLFARLALIKIIMDSWPQDFEARDFITSSSIVFSVIK